MAFVTGLLMTLLLLTAVFLIVLVLIQRGKGGGLAGAFGGMGGQSAFGTKAGDLFTRITIGVAGFWIVLCIITAKVLGVGGGSGPLSSDLGGGTAPRPGATAPLNTEKQPAGGKSEAPPKSDTLPVAPEKSPAPTKK
jgi:preprotein translocase subunit SecG